MHDFHIESQRWFGDDENGDETITERNALVETRPVTDPDLTVVRVWVADDLSFRTAELHVTAERQEYFDDDSKTASVALAIWAGALVEAINGATGALWLGTNSAQADLTELRASWRLYRLESPELHAEYSFTSYAMGHHLFDSDDEGGEY
jgi:hypothetical protein